MNPAPAPPPLQPLQPELTLRAVRLLERADVVVYDHLVSSAVLDFVSPTAQRIYAGKRRNEHWFCRQCGVRAFGVGNDTPMGKMYGVNVGCLEGVSEEELSKIPVTYVDGMNDRWSESPAFFSHL